MQVMERERERESYHKSSKRCNDSKYQNPINRTNEPLTACEDKFTVKSQLEETEKQNYIIF